MKKQRRSYTEEFKLDSNLFSPSAIGLTFPIRILSTFFRTIFGRYQRLSKFVCKGFGVI